MIGSDLKLQVMAKNSGVQTREVLYIRIKVSPKTYTGQVQSGFFERDYDTFTLNGGQGMGTNFSICLLTKC